MSFISWQYPLLLLISCLIYWQVGPRARLRVLLATSYYFYACWDVRFVSLMLGATCIDYLCGLAIADKKIRTSKLLAISSLPLLWLLACRFVPDVFNAAVGRLPLSETWVKQLLLAPEKVGIEVFAVAALVTFSFVLIYLFLGHRKTTLPAKAYLIQALCFSLGILFFFKYYGFFTESFAALTQKVGLGVPLPVLKILLPVGISFYTFQSLSYVIDIYRRQTDACESFLSYSAYVSFFPQLVAGPIERSKHLLPQILNPKPFSLEQAGEGFRLILVGYFKKVYVADSMALLANYAFDPTHRLNGYWACIGVVAFAFQIYGDFSGYTDIARGSARFLGVDLCRNFRYPYLSVSPSDFWRRWHISLSTWFRDYLYIPMGGNRCSFARTQFNLVVTMLVAGLWHGASWTYVLWGLYHGALLVLYRIFPPLAALEAKAETSLLARWPARLLFFGFCLFGWALFHPTMAEFVNWAEALAHWDAASAPKWLGSCGWIALHLIPLFALQWVSRREEDESSFGHLSWWWRTLIYLCLILLTVSAGKYDQEFIYFQF